MQTNNKVTLPFCLLLLFALAVSAQQEHVFDHFLQTQDGVTSAVIAITARNENIPTFLYAYGVADTTTNSTPSTSTTLYNIASVSKTFTGLLAMNLLPLQAQVPLLSDKVIGNAMADNYLLQPSATANASATAFHLMTHTAGLDERLLGLAEPTEQTLLSLEATMTRDVPPRIRNTGIVSCYSNYGIALLGLMVQQAAKQDFGQVLQQQVFDKLQMQHTIYKYNATVAQNAAKPTIKNAVTNEWITFENFGQYTNVAPAGAIYASAQDMSEYMKALLNGGTHPKYNATIIDSALLKQMWQEQFTVKQGVPGIGLIWFQGKVNNISYVYHYGVVAPYYTVLAIFPEQGLSFFASTVATSAIPVANLLNQFIATSIYNNTQCAHYDSKTATCFAYQTKASLASVEPTSTFAQYESCYHNFRFEHTTWFKVATTYWTMFPNRCFKSIGNAYLSDGSLVLVQEQPNLFKVYSVVNDTHVVIRSDTPSYASFVTVDNQIAYLVFNTDTWERNGVGYAFWITLFVLLIAIEALLIINFYGCCCCYCCCDLLAIFRPKKKADPLPRFKGMLEDFQDRDMEQFSLIPQRNVEEEQTQSFNSCLFRITGMFTWILILSHSFIPLLHIVHAALVVTKLALVAQPFQFYFHQYGFFLEAILILPMISGILTVLFIPISLITLLLRCINQRALGPCFSLQMIASSLILVIVSLLHVSVLAYFNLVGPTFAN